jgi:putative transposase
MNFYAALLLMHKTCYNNIMRKTFKYRIYPTKKQEKILNSQLESCRMLYNQFLSEKKELWENDKKSISLYYQINELPRIKKKYRDLKDVYSNVLQNIAVRVDLAYKAFFRRVKAGEKPGYPRFKSYGMYDSMTFPQYGNGIKIKDGRLVLPKVGHIKTVFHRPVEGIPKTARVKRNSTGKWYVSFSCEIVNDTTLPRTELNIGIDVGLETFAYMSDDTKIENPRFFRKEEKQLTKANRKLSGFPKPEKFKQPSPERKRAKKVLSRIHERIKFKREDFAHQEAKKIINNNQVICIEDLEVNRMVHNHCLAKSISDASWSMFFNQLFCKAEWAGRTVIKVNPAYTSQDCSSCGHRKKKSLSEREHNCDCCGLIINRDLNASINILRIGLDSLRVISRSPDYNL